MTEPEITRAVFVPGLMGAGILLSAGVLLADGVRRLLPKRGVRRRIVIARGVHAVVAGAAQAAGHEAATQELLRREPRPRWVYVLVGATLGALAGLAIRAGLDGYTGAGTLQGNPWPIGLGIVAGTALGLAASLAFGLGALGRRLPPLLRRLVSSTPAGRLEPPPEDRHERAHLLVPAFEEGEEG